MARAATPLRMVPASVEGRIVALQWVSPSTRRRWKPPSVRQRALHVDGVRNGLQVGRVDAMADAAEMVDLQPLGDGADMDLVGVPVRVRTPTWSRVEHPIPGRVHVPLPEPAPARVRDVPRCEPLLRRRAPRWHEQRVAIPDEPSIVRTAVPITLMLPFAVVDLAGPCRRHLPTVACPMTRRAYCSRPKSTVRLTVGDPASIPVAPVVTVMVMIESSLYVNPCPA